MTDLRATGRDVILAVAENMRSSLEPLVTKTIAPSLYQVYLHSADYERLRTIFGELEAEAKELLERELARLNRGASPAASRLLAPLRSWRRKGRDRSGGDRDRSGGAGTGAGADALMGGTLAAGGKGRPAPHFVSAEGRWFVRFQEDPNGALLPGDIQVVSEFAQRPAVGYGSGAPTHRISTTRRLGRSTTQRETADSAAAYARIAYKDDSGPREFWVVKDEIVIGRDAPDVWVDLRLETSLDVSREHARLRRVPESGAFRIKDLSKLGTTVNGKPLPSSLEGSGEAERDLDRWTDLPDRARIGLAAIVFLDFERTARS
ncbi:MAG TPA: FHA domain-containing protein [Thermoanaerobaculia bacterium]|nr:FHA domain-containing protein [Thermoanaerobaculia bacterium]